MRTIYTISLTGSLLLSAVIYFGGAVAQTTVTQAADVRDLLRNGTALTVWLVVDPINCRVTANLLSHLEKLRWTREIDARLVLVNLPGLGADRDRIVRAFSTTLPVSIDADGGWSQFLARNGFGTGAIVVSRAQTIVAMTTPAMLGAVGDAVFSTTQVVADERPE